MIEIILPAMGEGIIEAEITRWLVTEGENVEQDQPIIEVATDKVDSEIPSPGSGILHKILLYEGDTANVGQVLALIAKPGESAPVMVAPDNAAQKDNMEDEQLTGEKGSVSHEAAKSQDPVTAIYKDVAFLSPVIRKIAVDKELSPAEIRGISGSGTAGRITKADVLEYLAGRNVSGPELNSTVEDAGQNGIATGKGEAESPETRKSPEREKEVPALNLLSKEQIYGSGRTTVEEMDRMRKLIADHMVYSRQVAPHVNSFVESDVTEMILWRNHVKKEFLKSYQQKLTITTLIIEAVIRALKEHPRINVSVDGYKLIQKHDINLGMATALPDGNLIVPVIHGADKLNLVGLATKVNDLAERARTNNLLPPEIQGGTFTVTNMGQFGNIAGTPIINQPQVAILAIGAIVKKPAVVETPEGDTIGIRNMLILSLAYDHRVVDGALGGAFLKSIGDRLQGFDSERVI